MAGRSSGKYLFHLIEGLPQLLWSRVAAPMNDDDWRLSTLQAQTLRNLIGDAAYQSVRSKASNIDQSRQLRVEIAPLLTSPSYRQKGELCQWIVRDWGRIRRRGVHEVALWPMEFGCFEPENVQRFIRKRRGKSRISSWSKVLAFALPDHYAIYDSRNALALNVLLQETRVPNRFFMPSGQGENPPPALVYVKERLKALYGEKNIKWAGYEEYNALLRAMAAVGGIDLLGTEMRLFSHSGTIAQSWAAA